MTLALGTDRLVARTVATELPDDLVTSLGPDGFAWEHGGATFVTAGIAARVRARDIDAMLAAAQIDDEVRRPGTGAIALGALPFADASAGWLTIPRRVVGRGPDGTTWRTDIRPEAESAVGDPTAEATSPIRSEPDAGPAFGRATESRAEWSAAVAAALTAIDREEFVKVVLARTIAVTTEHAVDPRWLLRRLRAREPDRYLFASASLVGASPELLVERIGSDVRSCPLAGSSRSTEASALEELAHSAKDHAEHRIVVDAMRAVLAQHCTEVAVAPTAVVGLADLGHLATRIAAVATAATPSALGLALALHPTPAVGGWPTAPALAHLAQREPDRGHYAGPVGWVDARGDGQWAVALRSAELLDPTTVLVRAGAGIVAGSDADLEWDEIDAKLSPVLRALRVN